jgi:hypothetical protein
VPAAPAASCALVVWHTSIHHRSTGTPGLPCAMVLTAYFALSSVTGLSCHRRQRIKAHHDPVGRIAPPQDLTPASGRQDHTTSPSATSTVRLRAGCSLTDSIRTRPAIPFARRRCRVHRIPRPTSVTIAIRPSLGTGWQRYRSDLGLERTGIFLQPGLDSRTACRANQAKSSSLRKQGPVRGGLSMRRCGQVILQHLTPVVMGPCFRRDDI